VTSIVRNPQAISNEKFDIVIVGGGIHGVMLLLQAVQQDLNALLLERNDFGAGTSFNSLRIIHGGFRYLQSLDLARFYESVAERKWFLRTYPNLVKPMACMMPLYNKGVKRPEVLKFALLLNDCLSAARNQSVSSGQVIGSGRVLSVAETREKFPGVIMEGLTGSALWYDAHAPDTQRIIMDTLKWACGLGARAFNYVEVKDVLKSGDKVIGVQVKDQLSNTNYEYRCDFVVNATGPLSRDFSRRQDRDVPELFRPSRAWNVLFDMPAVSECALALTPDRYQAQTYFLHPWKGRLLAGTGHAPIKRSEGCDPNMSDELLEYFVDDMNLVMPDLELSVDNIEHIYAGCLPVSEDGGTKLTKRAVIYDHGAKGGPKGLYSVSGIKFTTSRKEAEKTLQHILCNRRLKFISLPPVYENLGIKTVGYDWMPSDSDEGWKTELKKLIDQESPVCLDDLIYRRTSLGDNPGRVRALANEVASLFDWSEARIQQEVSNLIDRL